MKHSPIHLSHHNTHNTYQLTWPCTDESILHLQDMFLSNGIHTIRVTDQKIGRTCITSMLKSLHCYQEIAYLSLCYRDVSAINLYEQLCTDGYIPDGIVDNFIDFFVERLYVDFLWIDQTPDILAPRWYREFVNALRACSLESHIPIVIVES